MPARPYDLFSIRDYHPDDFATLHRIDLICFPDYMAYSKAELAFFLGHPAGITRVAERRERTLGYVVGRTESISLAHVITLDVIPEARRQGVGSSLMAALHEEFLKRGVMRVALEVDVANEGAQRFYERLGYERTSLLRHYYKNDRDAYRMSLLLRK